MDVKRIAVLAARQLRKNATEAEKALWERLRKRKLNGLKFLRQYPVNFEYDGEERFFIADFYCHEKRLIIEIDGGIHHIQKEYDSLRDSILHDLGFRIRRFSNHDVLSQQVQGIIPTMTGRVLSRPQNRSSVK
jgi:very-short-patch-repair endonuclease